MAKLVEAGLLIFDDLGAEKNTDRATEGLFVLINTRHDWHRRTIITTNLSPRELAIHLGERIVARILELADGHTVSLEGLPNLGRVCTR